MVAYLVSATDNQEADSQFNGNIEGMSSDERSPAGPNAELTSRLGYLLKHAQLRLNELTSAVLAPHDVDAKEWAVLLALATDDALSQLHVAYRLRIDRTTMVALLDALEAKGLVVRRPHPADRRRNVVELTTAGRDTLDHATKAGEEAERRFLSPLDHRQAHQLRDALRVLIGPEPQPRPKELP
jgi:DNA-binding MarR family transcriptional regulator